MLRGLGFLTIIWLIFLILSCAPSAEVGSEDTNGCMEPPPSVFTAAGIDIEFAKSDFGKIMTGDISFKTKPEVISLASKAVTDLRILAYLNCRAIKNLGYTTEQVAYQDRFAKFINTKPTADQVIQWQEKFPFPKGKSEASSSVPIKPLYYLITLADDLIKIKINGEIFAENLKAFTTPYRIIPAKYLKTGSNNLEIIVTNLNKPEYAWGYRVSLANDDKGTNHKEYRGGDSGKNPVGIYRATIKFDIDPNTGRAKL